jgi:mono/diheme cytochrome c family protein
MVVGNRPHVIPDKQNVILAIPSYLRRFLGGFSMVRTTVLIVLLLLAVAAVAQQATPVPAVKTVPAEYTSPGSGPEMYENYCASCHGADAKGHGPAAPALKAAPTDLTTLAKNHGGKFPAERFRSVLLGKTTIPAHGSLNMPVWGKIFWKMSEGHQGEVQQRIYNLTNYVEGLQQK